MESSHHIKHESHQEEERRPKNVKLGWYEYVELGCELKSLVVLVGTLIGLIVANWVLVAKIIAVVGIVSLMITFAINMFLKDSVEAVSTATPRWKDSPRNKA